jgi:hypothetical protein
MSDQVEEVAPKKPPAMPKVELVQVAEVDNEIGLRTRLFVVEAESPRYRDKGTHYLITEKPAEAAELWAVKALNVLVSSGVEIDGDAMSLGMRGMARLGVQALGNLPMELVKDMLGEMFQCIQIVPGYPNNHRPRPLQTGDTREIMTRFLLRAEVFNIHTDFLQPVAPSTSPTTAAGPGSQTSVTTPTSLGASARPSHRAKLR